MNKEIMVLVSMYREYGNLVKENLAFDNSTMVLIYAEKRAAIYDALMMIAEYDQTQVEAWIHEG